MAHRVLAEVLGTARNQERHCRSARLDLCLVDWLRGALRRRDVFAAPSLRFGDPRIGLLDGAAWEAARPTMCRTLAKSQNAAEEIGRLSNRLDHAFRSVAGNLPKNASVRIEKNGADEDLVLTGLDRLQEPVSLVALRNTVAARLPHVDLPELLPEIDARTGFAGAFTHASEADARARTCRRACAPSCWPRRATRASNRWCGPTCRRSGDHG